MGESAPITPQYIDEIVDFPNGCSYQLLKPLATYRSCHDGTPAEARIVLTCRRMECGSSSDNGQEYVMKIKIQYCLLPEPSYFPPFPHTYSLCNMHCKGTIVIQKKLTSRPSNRGESPAANSDPATTQSRVLAPRQRTNSRRCRSSATVTKNTSTHQYW